MILSLVISGPIPEVRTGQSIGSRSVPFEVLFFTVLVRSLKLRFYRPFFFLCVPFSCDRRRGCCCFSAIGIHTEEVFTSGARKSASLDSNSSLRFENALSSGFKVIRVRSFFADRSNFPLFSLFGRIFFYQSHLVSTAVGRKRSSCVVFAVIGPVVLPPGDLPSESLGIR